MKYHVLVKELLFYFWTESEKLFKNNMMSSTSNNASRTCVALLLFSLFSVRSSCNLLLCCTLVYSASLKHSLGFPGILKTL